MSGDVLDLLDDICSDPNCKCAARTGIDEITRLRAEVDALRAALRKHAIGPSFTASEQVSLWCRECEQTWRNGDGERHAPGCLAAPRSDVSGRD